MSLLSVCAGDGDIASSVLTLFVIPIDRAFFLSTTMSKNYINHIGTYNDHSKSITINGANANVSDLVRSFMSDDIEDITPDNSPSTTAPQFFRVSEKFTEQNIRDRLAAALNQSTTKIEYCRALYQLQHIGCIDIDQYTSDEKRAKVLNEYQSTYKLTASDFCKARATRYAQN